MYCLTKFYLTPIIGKLRLHAANVSLFWPVVNDLLFTVCIIESQIIIIIIIIIINMLIPIQQNRFTHLRVLLVQESYSHHKQAVAICTQVQEKAELLLREDAMEKATEAVRVLIARELNPSQMVQAQPVILLYHHVWFSGDTDARDIDDEGAMLHDA
jgi:hypothetical protein